jgi:hypothetical protein
MVNPPEVRTGQGPSQLSRDQFAARFRSRFFDPAFARHEAAIDEVLEIAWNAYENSRKSPRTQPAGPGFADPTYELSSEWLAAKAAIDQAQREHDGGDAFDADSALHEEVRNAALSCVGTSSSAAKACSPPMPD